MKTNIKKTELLSKTEFHKRIFAFLVTGLTVFVLTCLIWPFSVTTFRSVASIKLEGEADAAASDKLESTLSEILNQETTDERLESLVAQIEAAGKPQTKQIEFRDHDSIRNALMMGINRHSRGLTVLLGYDGQGAADERELVNLLTARVAQRLNQGSSYVDGQPISAELTFDERNKVKQLKAAQDQSLDEATWIVDQIETELGYVKKSLAQVGTSIESQDSNSTPFQYASSTRKVSTSIDPVEMSTTIGAIDVQPLRSILTDIRTRTDIQTTLLSKHEKAGTHSVKNLKTSQTRPINGTPSIPSTILLGMFSLVVATMVALSLDPFVSKGFESSNSLEAKLGVPIVAEIQQNEDSSTTEKKQTTPWANRVAHYSGLCLFGIFVVVAGFILINSEVRETFFENPLYGCAKIIRIFAGY